MDCYKFWGTNWLYTRWIDWRWRRTVTGIPWHWINLSFMFFQFCLNFSRCFKFLMRIHPPLTLVAKQTLRLSWFLGYVILENEVHQILEDADENDRTYDLYGLRKSACKTVIAVLLNILLLGIPYIVCVWSITFKAFLLYNKAALNEATHLMGKMTVWEDSEFNI